MGKRRGGVDGGYVPADGGGSAGGFAGLEAEFWAWGELGAEGGEAGGEGGEVGGVLALVVGGEVGEDGGEVGGEGGEGVQGGVEGG